MIELLKTVKNKDLEKFLKGNNKMKNYQVKEIEYNDTKDYILNIHYARRMPQIKYKFGLYENGGIGTTCLLWYTGQ